MYGKCTSPKQVALRHFIPSVSMLSTTSTLHTTSVFPHHTTPFMCMLPHWACRRIKAFQYPFLFCNSTYREHALAQTSIPFLHSCNSSLSWCMTSAYAPPLPYMRPFCYCKLSPRPYMGAFLPMQSVPVAIYGGLWPVQKCPHAHVSAPFCHCKVSPCHGGGVSSLLYATPPPVEVGRRPLGGGGGGGGIGGGGSGRGDGGGSVGGEGPGGAIWGSGGGGIGSRYLPLPSLMGES